MPNRKRLLQAANYDDQAQSSLLSELFPLGYERHSCSMGARTQFQILHLG
jgi:hypothetical protein